MRQNLGTYFLGLLFLYFVAFAALDFGHRGADGVRNLLPYVQCLAYLGVLVLGVVLLRRKEDRIFVSVSLAIATFLLIVPFIIVFVGY